MYFADLHIHSRFSRATSRDGDLPHLDLWARRKGILLVGTGDFTHPAWRAEMAEQLCEAEEGLYRLKDEFVLPDGTAGEPLRPRFVVSGEISTIYKKDGKTRKVHHVILLPSLAAAEALSNRLAQVGNIRSDGRPILGLDSRDLLEIALETCPDCVFIPAHIWTPHFSVFGAFSGFERLEDCYGDLTHHIHALETGLSSDPPMNRRLSRLDRYQLVSHSDAHSPAKLGREADMLDGALSYPALKRALDTGEGLLGTVEFYPEEGKYHLDGHRACHCCLEPAETIRLDGRCPVCGRKVTVGVLHRVEELADRTAGGPNTPFESLMPLQELLGNCLGVGSDSKRAQAAYFDLLSRAGFSSCGSWVWNRPRSWRATPWRRGCAGCGPGRSSGRRATTANTASSRCSRRGSWRCSRGRPPSFRPGWRRRRRVRRRLSPRPPPGTRRPPFPRQSSTRSRPPARKPA